MVVTCSAHQKGEINKEDLNFTKKYDATAAYNQSKLANVLFARELGRQMLGELFFLNISRIKNKLKVICLKFKVLKTHCL